MPNRKSVGSMICCFALLLVSTVFYYSPTFSMVHFHPRLLTTANCFYNGCNYSVTAIPNPNNNNNLSAIINDANINISSSSNSSSNYTITATIRVPQSHGSANTITRKLPPSITCVRYHISK